MGLVIIVTKTGVPQKHIWELETSILLSQPIVSPLLQHIGNENRETLMYHAYPVLKNIRKPFYTQHSLKHWYGVKQNSRRTCFTIQRMALLHLMALLQVTRAQNGYLQSTKIQSKLLATFTVINLLMRKVQRRHVFAYCVKLV